MSTVCVKFVSGEPQAVAGADVQVRREPRREPRLESRLFLAVEGVVVAGGAHARAGYDVAANYVNALGRLEPALDHLTQALALVREAGQGAVEVFDREHDLPEAQGVRRGDRWRGPDQRRVASERRR